jgi:actin
MMSMSSLSERVADATGFPLALGQMVLVYCFAETLVLEFGSSSVKAGFEGYDAPTKVIPAVVGRPRMQCSFSQYEVCVGDLAEAKRGLLSLRAPICCGSPNSYWDDIELIMRHVFEFELGLGSLDIHPVLLIEDPLSSTTERDAMVRLLLDIFGVPAVLAAPQQLLAAFASGRATAMVVDLGKHISRAVPVYDGRVLSQAILSMKNVGGRDLDSYFMRLLTESGYGFNGTSSNNFELIHIRETMCYVALSFEEECAKNVSKHYELCDGQIISISAPLFVCSEALFQPSMLGSECKGLHITIFNSIMMCDESIRPSLFGNIILAGGSSMLPGLAERLQKELELLTPSGITVRVVAPHDRRYSAWIGGSIMAGLPEFGFQTAVARWRSKEDFHCGLNTSNEQLGWNVGETVWVLMEREWEEGTLQEICPDGVFVVTVPPSSCEVKHRRPHQLRKRNEPKPSNVNDDIFGSGPHLNQFYTYP